jgi:hypothetical protein
VLAFPVLELEPVLQLAFPVLVLVLVPVPQLALVPLVLVFQPACSLR